MLREASTNESLDFLGSALPDSDSKPEIPLQSLKKPTSASNFIKSNKASDSSDSDSTPLAQRKEAKAPRHISLKRVIEISDSEPDVPLIRVQSFTEHLKDIRSQRGDLRKSSAPSTSAKAPIAIKNGASTSPTTVAPRSPHSSPPRPRSTGLLGSGFKKPHQISGVRIIQAAQKGGNIPRTASDGGGGAATTSGHVEKKAKLA